MRNFLTAREAVVRHRYAGTLKFSAISAGTPVNRSYTMRMNSLFDPDFSGAGHQPYGYDQMART